MRHIVVDCGCGWWWLATWGTFLSHYSKLGHFLHVTGVVQLSTVFITQVLYVWIECSILCYVCIAIVFHFHICVLLLLLLLLSVLGCSNAV